MTAYLYVNILANLFGSRRWWPHRLLYSQLLKMLLEDPKGKGWEKQLRARSYYQTSFSSWNKSQNKCCDLNIISPTYSGKIASSVTPVNYNKSGKHFLLWKVLYKSCFSYSFLFPLVLFQSGILITYSKPIKREQWKIEHASNLLLSHQMSTFISRNLLPSQYLKENRQRKSTRERKLRNKEHISDNIVW